MRAVLASLAATSLAATTIVLLASGPAGALTGGGSGPAAAVDPEPQPIPAPTTPNPQPTGPPPPPSSGSTSLPEPSPSPGPAPSPPETAPPSEDIPDADLGLTRPDMPGRLLIDNPTPSSGFSGVTAAETAIGWLKWAGLAASVAAMFIGGGLWGLAEVAGLPVDGVAGRRYMFTGAVGAVVVGLTATVINLLAAAI